MLIYYIFNWVLRSTIPISVLGIFILTVKSVFGKRFGARWHYYIWILLIIRLMMPYVPESPLSFFNLFNMAGQKVTMVYKISDLNLAPSTGSKSSQAIITGTKFKNINQYENYSKAKIDTNSKLKTSDKRNINVNGKLYLKLVFLIWLIGTIICGSILLYSNIRFWLIARKGNTITNASILNALKSCKVRLGVKKQIKLLSIDTVKTPAVYGNIKPRLLLPLHMEESLKQTEIEYIFMHELSHIKHRDNTINSVLWLFLVLNWFNPVLWYSFYRMRQDMELACDLLVLSYLKSEEITEYGHTIIKLLENYKSRIGIYGIAYMAGKKSNIKRRISMIASYKKGSGKWSVISIVLSFIIGLTFLTGAKTNTANANSSTPLKAKVKTFISLYKVAGKTYNGNLAIIDNPQKIAVGYDNGNSKKGITTSSISKQNNALMAINGGLFCETKNGAITPYGFIIHNGTIVYNSTGKNEKIQVAGFNSKGVLVVGLHSINELSTIGIKEAVVACAPPIIVNGKVMSQTVSQSVEPRTIIGQKANGSVILLTIDGRSSQSIGASINDVQKILLKYGAINAAVLDGGSSTTMYYGGKVINHPCSQNGETKIASAFMVMP